LRILHVLSQIELTGAEAHAVTLGEWQREQGHQVFLVSDTLNSKTDLTYFAMDIHRAKNLSRWKSVRALRQLLIDHQIDIVHAHSRAAVRVASKARRGLSCALVSTVHGRQHSSWSKKIIDIYGEKVIAVCENISSHLQQDFKMDGRKIHVIGNPIQTELFPKAQKSSAQDADVSSSAREVLKILLMGRTSGPKGQKTAELIQFVFPELLKEFSNLKIDLVGGHLTELSTEAQKIFSQIEKQFPGRIGHENFVKDPDQVIARSHLVIGAGRVALSAAMQGLPVLTLGEHQSHGLLKLQNLDQAMATNFGDIGFGEAQALDHQQILQQIRDSILSKSSDELLRFREELLQIRKTLLEKFSLSTVGPRVIQIYKAAYFKRHVPRWFPIMMYHKVVDQPLQTQHRIFVTKHTFEKHLKFYKFFGFQTLSFKDLADFWHLRRPMSEFPKKPLMITFDDGYLNNLQNAVPLLQKYGFQSTVFLLANTKMKANSWDEADGTPQLPLMNSVERLQLKKTGQEIGSHGFEHSKLTSMTEQQTWAEIHDSKAILEKEFAENIFVYAYTYGLKNEFSEQAVEKSKYDFAVNTTTGGLHISENPYSIFRVSVFPEDGFFDIFKKTSPWYRRYYFNKRGE